MAINFAPRPTENSDPWYRVRETYDESLESGISSLNSDLSTERGRINSLTSDLSTERGRINSLISDLSTERGRIDDLTSDLSTERGRIDDLVDRVDVLEATSYRRREVIPTRTNLNTVVEPGIYTLLQSSDYSQIPTDLAHSGVSAILEVKRGADSTLGAVQEIIHNSYRYYRTINNFGNRTWRPWRRIAIETESRVHIVGGYGSDPYGETEGGYGFSSEVV